MTLRLFLATIAGGLIGGLLGFGYYGDVQGAAEYAGYGCLAGAFIAYFMLDD